MKAIIDGAASSSSSSSCRSSSTSSSHLHLSSFLPLDSQLCFQLEKLQVASSSDKKRLEEELNNLQLQAKGERLRWEKEREQLYARGLSEKKQWQEKATELNRELALTAARLNKYDELAKDPWQLFLFAIQRTFNPSDETFAANI